MMLPQMHHLVDKGGEHIDDRAVAEAERVEGNLVGRIAVLVAEFVARKDMVNGRLSILIHFVFIVSRNQASKCGPNSIRSVTTGGL